VSLLRLHRYLHVSLQKESPSKITASQHAFPRMDQNRKRKKEDEASNELNMGSGIRRKVEIDESFEKELQAERGITILKTNAEKKMTEKRLIVVLENANLELGTLLKSFRKTKHKQIDLKIKAALGSIIIILCTCGISFFE